ncbi:MAG: thymidine kinase [Bacilli bacterium]|nr:thymidine kinase [Bacilli bacterium]
MAKMHFKYASMNSGKSIDLIRTAHNYEENGYKVLIMKPAVDTKGEDYITSRIGLSRKVDELLLYSDDIIKKLENKLKDISCILIDEAQFLSIKQVDDLFLISKACDIPVICYGLRTNFKMESFAGSKRLLELSDILEGISTLCNCGEIARYVGRKVGNKYVKDGEEIVIDGTENITYVPLCGKCYLERVCKINLKDVKKRLIKED